MAILLENETKILEGQNRRNNFEQKMSKEQ